MQDINPNDGGAPAPSSKTDLSGRTVIVTGGGAGIGQAIASTLAGQGARVAIFDRVPERIDNVVAQIEGAGGTAWGATVDITDESAAQAAVAQVIDQWGTVDVLVNCAGVFDDQKPAAIASTELWNRVIAVNLTAVFVLTRTVLPHMVRAGRGSIINIASVAGIRGGSGGVAYTASKHGVIGLTRSVAWGYRKEGIRCNAICPGAIEGTEIMNDSSIDAADYERCRPVGELAERGQTQSIADGVLFLASDQSAFVNGVILPVDGGWCAG
jgi:NAD(P)-dependent dehydrogenase (short-subunit alcohol dehydrogenase family)